MYRQRLIRPFVELFPFRIHADTRKRFVSSAKNSAEEGKAKPAATTAAASAKRGQTEEEKKRSNDWLDTSCRTEATVGLIKLRELAEVSSGLFRGVGEGGRPGLCCTATQINFPGMALSLRSTHLRNNTR